MRIEEFLNQRAERLAQTRRWIKDLRVFDFNYIPDQPLMRQEVKPLIDALLRYITTGIAEHLLVFGSRGSGKTLMVKYLSRLLTDRHPVHFAYVNCRQHNTSFKILAHLLKVRPRGCSLDELWARFTDRQPGRVVFILDEVDLISEKDRNREILYLISRAPQNYMALLLSNNPRFINSLDESIRSTLQPHMIHFRNYDAEQIRHILQDRAHLGLTTRSENRIAQTAALTVRCTNSDVRVALKTLYYHALDPDQPISELFQMAQHDLVVDLLNDLNDRNLLILKAALDVPERFVKIVYPRYTHLSRSFHEEPCSYMHFYNNLSYLQSLGLILLISTKVTRAYTNRIQLLFSPESFHDVFQKRFS